MRLNAKQIAQYSGGRFLIEAIDPSEILFRITWDSRNVNPGDLYVALPGEKTDGHAYVLDAIQAGARCVLVSDAPSSNACRLAQEFGIGIIEVPNTFHAISDLAREWRAHLSGKVIAVTGSVGKTTTKNLIRDVLASKFTTVATAGNQNNELGVPNTILSADPDTEMIVVEMGMRGLGQIAELCDICRPDWGAITNIGETHMELLGSQDAIAQAKAELLEALPMGVGCAFLNAEDPYTQRLCDIARLSERDIQRVLFASDTFDIAESFDMDMTVPSFTSEKERRVWAQDVSIDGEGCPSFTLCARGFSDAGTGEPTLFDMEPDTQKARVYLTLRGRHNVANACEAAAVGLAAGISIEGIAAALGESLCEVGRMEKLVAHAGFSVINDAYNASPESMKASLQMFSSMEISGRRVAVLGDMGELGDIEIECHRGVGRYAAEMDLDELICIGDLSRYISEGAREAGMDADRIRQASSIGEVLGYLEGDLNPNDAVLVKASHFMELNRVVDGLVS